MASLFISYSRKDINAARKLTEAFKDQDLDFWIDWEGIPPTVDWWKEVEKGIEEADTFLFLISLDSASSPVCKREIEHAVKNGKRMIPIVVRDIRAEQSPSELRPLNWIFLREEDDFQTSFGKLMTAIKTDYAWVQVHRRLQVKALEWERSNYEKSLLLRGKDLQAAEAQLVANSAKEPHPTDLQSEYVLKSRQAADRQRVRNATITTGVIIGLAALTVVAFVESKVARQAQATAEVNASAAKTARANAVIEANGRATAQAQAEERAKIALARQLAVQAQSINATRNSRQMIAALLAIQSMKIFPSSEAAQFLLNNNFAAHAIADLPHDGPVSSVGFSPDGKHVVSGSGDRTARVWEAATGKEVARMIYDGAVTSVAFSPDGKHVVSGSGDGTARVWEATTGKEIARMTHNGTVTSVAFSPDGKVVVSGGCDNIDSTVDSCVQGSARVWEATTGKEIGRMTNDSVVTSVAFNPDGKVVVSGSRDGTARVWEAATGKEVARMTNDGGVTSVAFSPDGKYVVSGSGDGTARVWEAATGKQVARMIHDDGVTSVAFSPDGKYVISGSDDGTARVWEATTGKEIARMTHNGTVTSVAFSPDSKYVVSGSGGISEGTASVWDASTSKEVARMTSDSTFPSVAFSPDGKYVVSFACDKIDARGFCTQGSVRVWEAATGKEVARMIHDDIVRSVAFSPDSKYVVSGSDDKTARVWAWQPKDLIANACAVMLRNLTREEWKQYIGDALPYEAVCPNLQIEPEPFPLTSPTP